ncbi:DUF397 domain-containing protein [Streptomyces sp. SL13]|uniref:DUF397 domain-containing protein n=1 Tax=Streptantibioticus silvisoli TaxID=2705255 RepID=A0AA90K0K4_9ACTN|nr:DUF397 domain-containing protein [Streptantibioticus silvisoli]MDI5964779.1 DUF397 domain-containing protein [Streptantibioticus silvisoli]MDI5973121.1 DUF397 domain-containing protein [Streptantibioticus silvisoli]
MTTESPLWFKSSHSSNGGACVEIATNLVAPCGIVPVRDSKDPDGPALTFAAETWSAFVDAVGAGRFGAV